jgi:probable HAF family extracellular repeat protein
MPRARRPLQFWEPLAVAAAMGSLGTLLLPGALQGASFRRLGVLASGPSAYSQPSDISADGTVVVGESYATEGPEAFRWTQTTGMVGLGTLGGEEASSTALGVSSNGDVIVGASRSPSSGPGVEAFRWTQATGMVGMGYLPGGISSSAASRVSDDGSVVTGASTSHLSPNFGEAFRWTQSSGLVGLGVLVANGGSVPWGISGDGTTIVGWAFSENGREAFRWTESEGLVGMGDLPEGGFDSWATSVSVDGRVIAGMALNPGQTSFRWTAETGMVDLGRPAGGNYSQAWGMSADGSIVVGEAGVAGERVPAIWTKETGMRNLVDVLVGLGLADAMEGWDLEQATTISADGLTIAGMGINPAGEEEAWLAYLGAPSSIEIPAASNVALGALAALLSLVGVLLLRLR